MALVMRLAIALLTSASDEPIRDNSFLLEEAFNQEPGVIQHISSIDVPRDGTWEYTFTEEWPLGGETHQLSFTLGAMSTGEATGISDWLINYRLGVELSEQVHLAPRLSLVIPTGDANRGLGFGSFGPEANVAFSVEGRILALHTNAGLTYLPSARNEEGQRAATLELRVGQSAIWLASPFFNLLVEALWTREQDVVAEGQTEDDPELLISPGARFAVELGSVQMVFGLGLPINVLERSPPVGIFGYLSFEHPFTGEKRSE